MSETHEAHECQYARELDELAELVQRHHPIGRFKAIGRLEVLPAVRYLLEPPPKEISEVRFSLEPPIDQPVPVNPAMPPGFGPSPLKSLLPHLEFARALDDWISGKDTRPNPPARGDSSSPSGPGGPGTGDSSDPGHPRTG
jgi:hypothetical protein